MRPLRILNVAEKNDAAKELSRIMSRGQSLRVRPGSNAVLHMNRTQFNQLSSCEVRRLTKLSSTNFIWSG